ncbi:golgin subfamily A member 6-like protein 2 [Fopius arisanus]|uniref:Golgin subfamily A member 6-like protein 2 n=1 Tax=Fopius arisanus TaxID=64838 RepID=A0A9R1UBP0_9HYME|nr:PREDICTED: golgin subfamily A member 6-like protein 2 [Fopius arisanus]
MKAQGKLAEKEEEMKRVWKQLPEVQDENKKLERQLANNQKLMEEWVEYAREWKRKYEKLSSMVREEARENWIVPQAREITPGTPERGHSRTDTEGETERKNPQSENEEAVTQIGEEGEVTAVEFDRSEAARTLAHDAPAPGGSGVAAEDERRHKPQNPQKTETRKIAKNPTPRKLEEEEWIAEKIKRRERKKGIIIKGLTLIEKRKKEELDRWMEETMGVKARVSKLDRVGNGTWRAELEEWETKAEIMARKQELKKLRWGVWITDDLTDRQKEVQTWIEREGENWRRLGHEVSTKYQKICVDGTWLCWDETEGTMKLEKKKANEGYREEEEEAEQLRYSPPPQQPFRGRGRGGRQLP